VSNMPATVTRGIPSGPEWLYELKLDGSPYSMAGATGWGELSPMLRISFRKLSFPFVHIDTGAP
jgi:hypothetical protein